MIRSAIRWREAAFYPQVAIRVAVCINRVRAGSGIRNKRAPGPLIRPKNWVETDVRTVSRFIFPKPFAAFRLSRRLSISRSEPPNGTDVHQHDAAGVRVETDIEFALTTFGRRSGGSGEN